MRSSVYVVPYHTRLDEAKAVFLHLVHDLIDLLALFAELAIDGKRASDIGAIAAIFAAGVDKHVEWTLGFVAIARLIEGSVVVHVMQSGGTGARCHDGMVGHIPAATLHAMLDEDGFKFPLIGGFGGFVHDCEMGEIGDFVGLAEHRDFIGVLGGASVVESIAEKVEVLAGEGEEGDMIRDLRLAGEAVDWKG